MLNSILLKLIRDKSKIRDLAAALNVKPTVIYMWLSRDKVPPRYWGPLVYYFKLDPKVLAHENTELHQDRN